MAIYHWILLEMKSVSGKSCSKNQYTHFMSTNFPPPPPKKKKNCDVYETVWKIYGTDGQATDDNLIWRMHFAHWLTKATDAHSESVIFNAFIWQQWLQEHASVLHLCVSFLYVHDSVHHKSIFICTLPVFFVLAKAIYRTFVHISLSCFHNLVTFSEWKFSPYTKSVPSVYTMPLMLQ
jgi:hypothetical protein